MARSGRRLGTARQRYLLDEYLLVVVLALLGAAALGGFLTYTAYAAPGTTTETRTVSSWETTPDLDHAATVTRDNEVFRTGRTLENRDVYYTRISPILDGTFRTGYRTTGEGSLDTSVEVDLVIRAVSEESNITYWRVGRSLASRETTDLAPGEVTATTFSLNISQVESRRDRVTGSLGGTAGTVETVVVARTTYDGSVNGREVSRTRGQEFPLVIEENTYRIRTDGVRGGRFTQSERVAVRNEPSPLRATAGPVLLALGLLGLAGLVVGQRTGRLELTAGERARLVHERERSEFEEWITAGRVSEAALDGPAVTVESLEGLVDIAIDTDRRVIETDTGRYFVPGDGLVYRYTSPSAPPAGRVGDSDDGAETADIDDDAAGATEAESADGAADEEGTEADEEQ